MLTVRTPMFYVYFRQQLSIPHNNINWLIFAVQTECVYRAVRTKYENKYSFSKFQYLRYKGYTKGTKWVTFSSQFGAFQNDNCGRQLT